MSRRALAAVAAHLLRARAGGQQPPLLLPRSRLWCTGCLRGLLLPDEGRVGGHSGGSRGQGPRPASDLGAP
eukprot:8493103-Alexandrium_andersonii.AAC.1